jgi:hypothetical protein
MDIKLEIDEETAIDFIRKKFGIEPAHELVSDLVGKSFPYIENHFKILAGD